MEERFNDGLDDNPVIDHIVAEVRKTGDTEAHLDAWLREIDGTLTQRERDGVLLRLEAYSKPARCEELAHKGTGTGACNAQLNRHGTCTQPWEHITT